MTADSADMGRTVNSPATADELFEDAAVVQSAADLGQDGVFDDADLEDFLADLSAMRRSELA